jgi:DNA-3-methyladenine glycosylase II
MHKKSFRSPQTILTIADMAKGVRALRKTCGHMRRIHARAGDPPLRPHRPGFEGLARIVVGQQLSLASAEAIWGRLRLAVQPMSAETLLALGDEELRSAGLSRGKVRTLRAISEAIAGGLDLDALANAPDALVHESLTALPGIGPWSADIYLLFCLGRADAFPADDLALQIVAARTLRLAERLSRDRLLAIAERWRPWRGVAAHLLWADYKVKPVRPARPKTT